MHIIVPHYEPVSYGMFIAAMPSGPDGPDRGERMGMPEFAKDMRVTTGYRSHVASTEEWMSQPSRSVGRGAERNEPGPSISADASRVITDRTRERAGPDPSMVLCSFGCLRV